MKPRKPGEQPWGQALVTGPDSAHLGPISVVMMVPRALTPHWGLALCSNIPEAGLSYKDSPPHQLCHLDHVNPRECPPRLPCKMKWTDSSERLD